MLTQDYMMPNIVTIATTLTPSAVAPMRELYRSGAARAIVFCDGCEADGTYVLEAVEYAGTQVQLTINLELLEELVNTLEEARSPHLSEVVVWYQTADRAARQPARGATR